MKTVKSIKGVPVGGSTFTDLDYADDIVLPVPSGDELGPCLAEFSQAARSMGLNVSWPKTKIQCLGRSEPLSAVTVNGNTVNAVDTFCYMGSIQDTSGRCRPDILRRLGIPASAVNLFASVVAEEALCTHQTTRRSTKPA